MSIWSYANPRKFLDTTEPWVPWLMWLSAAVLAVGLVWGFFFTPEAERFSRTHSQHAPRILLLYGSLRKRSFSRLVIEESARLLERMGAEVRIFNPQGLPLPDSCEADHPKVR